MSDLEREHVDPVDEIVDLMQQTRVHNNVEWMTILRIALKADPEQTKATIRKIAQYDYEIHGLWRRLGASQTQTKEPTISLRQRLANLRRRYPSTFSMAIVFCAFGVWIGGSVLWEPVLWVGLGLVIVWLGITSIQDDRKL